MYSFHYDLKSLSDKVGVYVYTISQLKDIRNIQGNVVLLRNFDRNAVLVLLEFYLFIFFFRRFGFRMISQ